MIMRCEMAQCVNGDGPASRGDEHVCDSRSAAAPSRAREAAMAAATRSRPSEACSSAGDRPSLVVDLSAASAIAAGECSIRAAAAARRRPAASNNSQLMAECSPYSV